MSQTAMNLPLWAEILVAIFAIGGGLIGLIGASGLLRLPTFFARIHAPALITTAGIWCLMLASITYFSVQTGKPALNVLLLGLFIAITAPVTTILIMRAALFRARQRGEDVPRSLNALQLATPKMAPQKDDDEDEEEEKPKKKKERKDEAEQATEAPPAETPTEQAAEPPQKTAADKAAESDAASDPAPETEAKAEAAPAAPVSTGPAAQTPQTDTAAAADTDASADTPAPAPAAPPAEDNPPAADPSSPTREP